jgi:ATP-dependent Lhr-like helicase
MVNKRASEQLHPLLRHHLVNTLGWRDLRPLQELAAESILGGFHTLVLAPTAGGKTEAAVLPVISRLLTEEWAGTSILYLCPLKALLNNLHGRLKTYFGMVGRQAGLWHGDISSGERHRIESGQPTCLMTTPESLEVMMISSRPEPKRLLKDVRVVIVDEIHAFAGDDRGIHLLAVVERIRELADREIQRIGLSATVGNPAELLNWLAGHCAGPSQTVAVTAGSVAADVTLDYVGNLENAALVISRLHRGEKRLVFCDSRRRVEELTVQLQRLGVKAFVSHSSLSLERRREAEHAFSEGENCVIVATSTLELGIDVGDLHRVIQIDAPATVASFLQRLGRTGRRGEGLRNCLFLATSTDALLQASAVIALWEDGFIEPIIAPRDPFHLFAQQLMALSLQRRGILRNDWKKSIGRISAFARMELGEVEAVIEHLVKKGILGDDGVWLSIGDEGEKRFGRRHFLELVSVFASSPNFEVLHGNTAIGGLDWLALAGEDASRLSAIILAGRTWQIQKVDWQARRVFVVPSEGNGKAGWQGTRRGMSFEVAQRIQITLSSSDVPHRWSARAKQEMEIQRASLFEWAVQSGKIYRDAVEDAVRWSTFAGTAVNEMLCSLLRQKLDEEVRSDGFSIILPSSVDLPALRAILIEIAETPNLTEKIATSQKVVDQLKFSLCLPPNLARRAVHGRLGTSIENLKSLCRNTIRLSRWVDVS